jgi:glycosyltransferase involved in cell wall biosynthesis
VPFCTFIVPTLGRDSLQRAIESLIEQTDPDWEAIVIGDNVDPAAPFREQDWYRDNFNRHRLHVGKAGPFGTAGAARNFGCAHYSIMCGPRAEWIAFLDDDDHLRPTYVEHLREQAEDYPWADAIVSRMLDPRFGILPDPVAPRIELGHVGISFAIRAEIIEAGLRFVREDRTKLFHEDFEMLKTLRERGRRIHISPHVDYLVRDA